MGIIKKFVYIDTENTGYAFADILDKLDKTYNIRLIYTQFNDKMSVSYLKNFINTKAKVDFIETKNGNANALDFCLVADVCYNASMNKKASHIIYSRDRGYLTAVDYLRGKGIDIRIVDNAGDIIKDSSDYSCEVDDLGNISSLSVADIEFLRSKITKVMSQFGVGVGANGLDGRVFSKFISCIGENKKIDFEKLKTELSDYNKFRLGSSGDLNLPLISMQLSSELSEGGFSITEN